MKYTKLVITSPTKERLEIQIRKFFYLPPDTQIRFLDNGKIQRVKKGVWTDYSYFECAKVRNRFRMYQSENKEVKQCQ